MERLPYRPLQREALVPFKLHAGGRDEPLYVQTSTEHELNREWRAGQHVQNKGLPDGTVSEWRVVRPEFMTIGSGRGFRSPSSVVGSAGGGRTSFEVP